MTPAVSPLCLFTLANEINLPLSNPESTEYRLYADPLLDWYANTGSQITDPEAFKAELYRTWQRLKRLRCFGNTYRGGVILSFNEEIHDTTLDEELRVSTQPGFTEMPTLREVFMDSLAAADAYYDQQPQATSSKATKKAPSKAKASR
jgi:hypothetical protein